MIIDKGNFIFFQSTPNLIVYLIYQNFTYPKINKNSNNKEKKNQGHTK